MIYDRKSMGHLEVSNKVAPTTGNSEQACRHYARIKELAEAWPRVEPIRQVASNPGFTDLSALVMTPFTTGAWTRSQL